MNTFHIKSHTWSGPSSFDELTPEQLIYFAALQSKNTDRVDLLRSVAYRFSGIPFRFYFNLNRIQQMHIEDQYAFLFEEFTMTTWKISKITSCFNTYHGPDGPLKNTTGAEFAYADKHFAAFAKGKNPTELDKFIACLYRPMTDTGNWIIDNRIPFEHREIPEYARKLSKVSFSIKYAVFLNYIGVRADMVKKHPHVFTDKSESKVKNFGWPGIFYELAGDKLGSEKEVQNAFIWNLLAIMEMNEIKRIEREAEIKANT